MNMDTTHGADDRQTMRKAPSSMTMRLRSRPWEITGAYAAIGLLWIFFSDHALALLVHDAEQLRIWSSYKGFGFVIITSVLLLLLLRRAFDVIGEAYASVEATENALRGEKLFTDKMLESMPGIMYFFDASGNYLRWNRNFERVSGYSGDEIAQLHPRDFFRGEDRVRIEQRIAAGFAEGESSIEALLIARDGTETPYFFTSRRIQIDDRLCLVGMGIDISDRRQVEVQLGESERKYRDLVEHANSIILRWDAAGQVKFLNEYGQRFFGYSAEEIIGQNVMGTLVPSTDSKGRDLQRLMEEIRAAPRQFEQNVNENMRRDGERVWISWTNRVEFDDQGEISEILSIGADITDRMRIEAEREMRYRAEAADRIKSAFLATMSHELRTPLNSIIGFTGIILQGLAGPLNPEQSKQLDMVYTSARHLLALVNDVLDISKIEAGQFEVARERFHLKQSVEQVLAIVGPQIEAKKLELHVELAEDLGEAVSDQRRFEQILLNLLSNAIKFTDRGGIELTAELIENYLPPGSPDDAAGERAVSVRVSDTGIGIKAVDLPSLFQPFRQIDSGLSRMYDGTGLGLAICRRLVTLMGGDIRVESEWEKGSTFCVTLPLQAPPLQTTALEDAART